LKKQNVFLEVEQVLKGFSEDDIGKIFIKAETTLASVVPSAMGTLKVIIFGK